MSQNIREGSDFIERILRIFESLQAVDWQKSGQQSKHWSAFNERKVFTPENIRNFRKSKILSQGLDDNKNFSFRTYALFASRLSEDVLLSFMPEKNVGNSDLVLFRDRYVDLNKMFPAFWYKRIQPVVFGSEYDNKIVCEIGGGYGSFAETLFKRENVKIILLDLPQANLLSSYFLHEHFPEKRFFLYDDYAKSGTVSARDIEEHDIFVLPPSCKFSDDVRIDLFINTRSMMEMNMSVIADYFALIQTHCRPGGYFLNVNRYEKRIGGCPIRIAEYPYDAFWDVEISEPAINQDHIHFLLAKRRDKSSPGNITVELRRIAETGKDFYTTDKPESLAKKLRRPLKPLYQPLRSALRSIRKA